MNPNENQNSQQGGGAAQWALRQTANKGLSFAKKYLLVSSTVICIMLITVFIVFFFGNTSGVAGVQPPTSQPTPPPGGQLTYTFVALGDSLTAWPNKPAGFILDPNCATLHSCDGVGTPWPSHLAAEDSSLSLIKNAGVPAETTTQILARFQSDVAAYKPDVLFVLGGTNDTGKGIDTIGNLKQIIADAKAAGIQKVILLTIPHQCPGAFSINSQILALKSDYVTVIDLNQASLSCTANPPDYQPDGLHFTDAGAQVVADIIDSAIKAGGILPTPTQPTGNFHLYCQYAYRVTATNTCDIYTYGCGPSSLAMILTTFGDTTTPVDVGTKYGMGCASPGTTIAELTSALNSLKPTYVYQSVGVSNGNLNITTVETLTGKGFYIITGACMTGGYSGAIAHTTVITGVNADGTFNEADPTWNSPPNHGCSTNANVHMRILNPIYPGPDLPAGTPCGWGGWNWAFAVKKQ